MHELRPKEPPLPLSARRPGTDDMSLQVPLPGAVAVQGAGKPDGRNGLAHELAAERKILLLRNRM